MTSRATTDGRKIAFSGRPPQQVGHLPCTPGDGGGRKKFKALALTRRQCVYENSLERDRVSTVGECLKSRQGRGVRRSSLAWRGTRSWQRKSKDPVLASRLNVN